MPDLKLIQEAYDKMDVFEMQRRFDEAERFYQNNFHLFQYDYSGNYIGEVPNENGWTP